MEWISELWLKPKGFSVKTKLGVEWPNLAIQIVLYGWLSDHRPPDNHLKSHPRRNLRLCSRWLRLWWRLWWLYVSWYSCFLFRKAVRWLLGTRWACSWCSGWSPSLISSQMRTERRSFYWRWNDRWLWRFSHGVLHRWDSRCSVAGWRR